MSPLYAIIVSTIAGLSTLIGAFVIFLKIPNNKINEFITLSLSFSIAIMIGISITDLLPQSLLFIYHKYSMLLSIIITLLSFGMGFIIIYFINYLNNKSYDSLYKLGLLSMIALMLHNFPEGIATFMGSIKSPSLGIKLAIAILLHNIPEGLSIAIPIYYSSKSKKKALFYTFISGIAEPLGAILTYIILNHYITNLMLNITLLLVSSIMITLAIEEMLPKALEYSKNKYIYIGLGIGLIILLANYLFL